MWKRRRDKSGCGCLPWEWVFSTSPGFLPLSHMIRLIVHSWQWDRSVWMVVCLYMWPLWLYLCSLSITQRLRLSLNTGKNSWTWHYRSGQTWTNVQTDLCTRRSFWAVGAAGPWFKNIVMAYSKVSSKKDSIHLCPWDRRRSSKEMDVVKVDEGNSGEKREDKCQGCWTEGRSLMKDDESEILVTGMNRIRIRSERE